VGAQRDPWVCKLLLNTFWFWTIPTKQ